MNLINNINYNILYKENKENISLNQNLNYLIGLIFFILFFIIFIPCILYKLNCITELLVYFLNIDLIASLIGNIKSPINKYFKYLYSDPEPLIGYISQSLISLLVLGSVFLIVVGRTKKNNLGIALIRFLFTILITFLLPNRFIIQIMDTTYNYLKNLNIFTNIIPYISTIPAIILIYLFIFIESYCLENYSSSLGNFFNQHINKLNFINKLEKYRK
tara:strand:+ start:403 stop:1053 length:651 start_codon:yes stop_codon:yes gene_type:complete